MCSADAISGPEAQRAALAAELMDELARIRAVGMKLIGEIERKIDEDPELAADSDIALRFQRVAQTVTRVGGLQLAILDAQTNFGQAAEEARQRRAAAQGRTAARAGKEKKARCAYLFNRDVLEPSKDVLGPQDFASMRRDLFRWLFEAGDDAGYAAKSIADIMVEITRSIGVEPPDDPQWETALRARWAAFDEGWETASGMISTARGPPPDSS